MDDLVLRADRDGACQLTLNRPDKLNALNVDLFKALEAHVADLEAAPGDASRRATISATSPRAKSFPAPTTSRM